MENKLLFKALMSAISEEKYQEIALNSEAFGISEEILESYLHGDDIDQEDAINIHLLLVKMNLLFPQTEEEIEISEELSKDEIADIPTAEEFWEVLKKRL